MPRTPPRRFAILGGLLVAGLMASACLPPTKAQVSVADLASMFPTVEALSVHVYMLQDNGDEDDCESFEYERGAFASDVTDEFCRVFDFDDRHPGGGFEGLVPVAFDQQALDDMATLKAEFARIRTPIDYMNVVFDPSGSIAPDSGFSADRCVMYWYHPGWSVLPEDRPGDTMSVGIDEDWYKTDSCP